VPNRHRVIDKRLHTQGSLEKVMRCTSGIAPLTTLRWNCSENRSMVSVRELVHSDRLEARGSELQMILACIHRINCVSDDASYVSL
jgi:hypothetical protein